MQYQLTAIYCTNCQIAIGYSWQPLQQPNHCLCEDCMGHIAYISQGLNLHDGLTEQDMLALDDKQLFNQRHYYNDIIDYKEKLRTAMNTKAILQIENERNKTC